jgi:hypothetical protein
VLGTAGVSSNLLDRSVMYYEQKLSQRYAAEQCPLERVVMIMLHSRKYVLGYQWAAARFGSGMDRQRAALLWKSRVDLQNFSMTDLDSLMYMDEPASTRIRYFDPEPVPIPVVQPEAGDLPANAEAAAAVLRGMGVGGSTAAQVAAAVTPERPELPFETEGLRPWQVAKIAGARARAGRPPPAPPAVSAMLVALLASACAADSEAGAMLTLS